MAVIRTAPNPSGPSKPRPHPALRVLNVAFSAAIALCVWGAGAYAILGAMDGMIPEKIACILIAASAGFAGLLIITQAFDDANPISLILVLLMAAAYALGAGWVMDSYFTVVPFLTRLIQLDVIDQLIFFGCSYLLIWERGARTYAGSDDVIDTLRSFLAVWPMLLVLMVLAAVEYLFW